MNTEKKYLSALNGLLEDDSLYVVDIDTWFFIKYDLKTGTSVLLADIQPRDYYKKLCWAEKILHIGCEFFIIIRNFNGIISVSENGNVVYYEWSHDLGANNSFWNIDAYVVDNLIYILPGYIGGELVVFDLRIRKFTDHIMMTELFDRDMNKYRSNNIWAYLYDTKLRKVRFSVDNTDMICTLDIRSRLIVICNGSDNDHFQMLSGEFNNPIIIENNGFHLCRYDDRDNKIRSEGDFERIRKSENFNENQIIFIADDYTVAVSDDMASVEIIKNEKISKILEMPEESVLIYEVRNYRGKFNSVIQDKDKAYLIPFSANGMVVFDKHTMDMKFYELEIPREFLMIKNMRQIKMIKERAETSLRGFILTVKTTNEM